jgi:signal transduction histidine kinase
LFLFFFLFSELIRGNGSFFIRYYGVYHPFWSLHIVETYNTLLVLAAVCNLYFYSESLKTRQTNPKLHRALMFGWIPHALLLPVIWSRILPMTFSLSAFFISPIGGYLVAGVVSVIRWREGFTSAKYYLLGSLFFFCGLLITGLSYANLFSTNNLLFQNLLNLSSISEIVCLALGFADSIRVERENTINHLLAINQELQQKNEAIKASLLEGQILERKRVERELHDGLGSVLFGVRASLFGIQHEKLSENQLKSYQNVEGLLLRAEREVKLIAHNQFPPELEEKGLKIALAGFVEDLNGLKVTHFRLQIEEFQEELNSKTQFELFSIIRELTANILKHARATEAVIDLRALGERVVLVVQDNGLGFDPSRKYKGLGMKNLSHRVEAELRGQVLVESDRGGTKVSITVPMT